MIPFLKKIQKHPNFDLKLLVGGAHLLEEYGHTIEEIKNDGFNIDYILPFLTAENNPEDLIRAMSKLQHLIGDCLIKIKPDIILIVGDRFELLPVASAALVLGIPIAHLSGGDVTEGAIDNQIRNAVSKISHLHFTGTDGSRKNLLRMGEEEWRVFNVGEPGIECILSIDLISKKDLFLDLNLNLTKPLVISTFHPETILNEISEEFLMKLFKELVKELPLHQFLITGSNFDLGGHKINRVFKKLSAKFDQIIFIQSLGQKRYYSILKHSNFMLGNSSSGIIEAQSFLLPVINVGNRQHGRERNINTIDVQANIKEIISTAKTINDLKLQEKIKKSKNIYGDGECSDKILKCFQIVEKEKLLLKKNVF